MPTPRTGTCAKRTVYRKEARRHNRFWRELTMSTETKRVAGVIVTHGQLASELLAAAEMIIGPISHIAAVSKKGITLRGLFGRRLWETWEQTMLLLDSGRLDLEWLITHRMPLGQIDEAVDLLTGDACKVLLLPVPR